MRGCGQPPDRQTCAILLDGLFKNLHFPEAMTLFQEMEDKRLDLNIVIYNILIDDDVDKGFSANATIATILIDLLSTSQADQTLQEFLQNSV
ncbi:hypothetical protein SLA2020_446310 [Shorea laevis]